jgi:hypothetical protein
MIAVILSSPNVLLHPLAEMIEAQRLACVIPVPIGDRAALLAATILFAVAGGGQWDFAWR